MLRQVRSDRVTKVFTIGYEGALLTDFIGTLVEAGVCHVLDIRELPQSRRPGFSKKKLSEALNAANIDYSHLKQLGDPKHGREAARRGDMDSFRMIFEAHLDLPESKHALEDAAVTVCRTPTVLLCYERNPKDCHRSLVAKHLLGLRSIQIQHLGVRSYIDERSSTATVAAVGYA
jgi:uncharacterized protein (DUF488 family)